MIAASYFLPFPHAQNKQFSKEQEIPFTSICMVVQDLFENCSFG